MDFICRGFIFVMSVLGLFVWYPFFSLTVLFFITEIALMRDLLTSIVLHIDKLFAVICMAMILLYWFATWGYFGPYKNLYNFGSTFNSISLYEMFRVHVDYGLMASPEFETYPGPLPVDATVFNFIYILLINMFITAIISGIIIDTFGELRGNADAIEEDNYNSCLICSLSREDFDRVGLSFEKHIKEEH